MGRELKELRDGVTWISEKGKQVTLHNLCFKRSHRPLCGENAAKGKGRSKGIVEHYYSLLISASTHAELESHHSLPCSKEKATQTEDQ